MAGLWLVSQDDAIAHSGVSGPTVGRRGYRTVLMALAALAAVCTVVAMTGLVRGASERILAAVTDMGANRITVLGTAGLEM